MQSSPGSRKRPAPGTSPLTAQQQLPQQQGALPYQQFPDNPDFNSFDFTQPFPGTDQTFSDVSLPTDSNNNFSSFLQNAAQPAAYAGGGLTPQPAAASTDLVRRTRNPNQSQALAPVTQQHGQQEQWNGSAAYANNTMNGRAPAPSVGAADDEDEAALELKVQLAKRDAQGKRKQIPPFVQKLSSFLDSNNTSLIRWSNDGRSFIVLDEDEFARTLIPELFKHNNYASFVRQLNMYGFHKTVNITDGSLRQSEKARKGVKPPSMYSHPYFRRGRQDLLWLIQKPSSKSGGGGPQQGKRKRDGAAPGTGVKEQGYDSDEDGRQFSPGPQGPLTGHAGAIGAALDGSSQSQDLVSLPRNELNSVRRELQKLQNQQRFISQMITQLKEQNDQFYRQATAFQALHDRHENSINAILTFLATFYNRSLDGHHGAQNLVNMFAGQQGMQQQGSVEEVTGDGGYDGGNGNANAGGNGGGQLQRYVRKPPLLLPGPVANLQNQNMQPGSAVTAPNSARTSVSPPNDGSAPGKRESTSSAPPEGRVKQGSTASPVIKNDAPTPNLLNQVPENDEMMSLINSVNATNASTPSTSAPTFDFSSALEHYQNANGNAPLTPQQRDSMLSLMATQQGGNQNAPDNSALVTPQPPQMPDLAQLKQTQQQLEMLTNMQRRQDERVQELNRRLVPLSPTGSIPGVSGQVGDEDPFNLTGGPGDYDPNAFINFDDPSWNSDLAAGGVGGGDGNDLNFDFGDTGVNGDAGGDIDWDFGAGGNGDDMFQTSPVVGGDGLAPPGQDGGQYGGGRVESVSSEATSPAGTVPDGEAEPGTPNKRQRRS